jgi:hypothetical protein
MTFSPWGIRVLKGVYGVTRISHLCYTALAAVWEHVYNVVTVLRSPKSHENIPMDDGVLPLPLLRLHIYPKPLRWAIVDNRDLRANPSTTDDENVTPARSLELCLKTDQTRAPEA